MKKRRAIQNALARFGMQAKPGQVVASLALHGIVVSEGLVRAVLMEMLKETGRVRQQRARALKPSKIFRHQKVLPRRGNRP